MKTKYYFWIGFIIGLLFPMTAWAMDFYLRGLSSTFEHVLTLHRINPVHWIIDTAPLVLGIILAYFGHRNRIRQKKIQFENTFALNRIVKITSFIKELNKGNLDAEYHDEKGEKSDVKILLDSFRNQLKTNQESEGKRAWVSEGLAKFADILKRSSDLKVLSDHIISQLVKYLGANQGSLFLLNDTEEGNPYLELFSCFAFDTKKIAERKIAPGQGLLGQCYLEKEMQYLSEVPKGYITITSGLGKAEPRSVIIIPMLLNEEVEGIIELASFKEIETHEREFLKKIAENIAASIGIVKVNERTRKLLNEAKKQADIMREQELIMKENMEDLSGFQEESLRKEVEYKERIKTLEEKLGL